MMRTVLAVARRGHRGLFWLRRRHGRARPSCSAVLAVVDSGCCSGAPLWFKPLKFAISFAALRRHAGLDARPAARRDHAAHRLGDRPRPRSRWRSSSGRRPAARAATSTSTRRSTPPCLRHGRDDRRALAGHARRRAALPPRARPRPRRRPPRCGWARRRADRAGRGLPHGHGGHAHGRRAGRRPGAAPGRLEHHRRRPADRATSSACTPCRACRCSPPRSPSARSARRGRPRPARPDRRGGVRPAWSCC